MEDFSNDDPGMEVIEDNAESFYLSNIYYDFDSYEIDQEEMEQLNLLAEYLKANPGKSLTVKSYTDIQGTKAYNKWLAKKRASRVVEFLIKTGVQKNRLLALGKGEAEESSEANPSENRRTEFVFGESREFVNTNDSSLEEAETFQSKIYFDFDSYDLTPGSISDVQQVINKLKEDPALVVQVNAHTDSRGSEAYNQWLSQERADAVVEYMVEQGIPISQVSGVGYGENNLINDCTDDVSCSTAEHAKNRRIDFVFYR